MQTEKNSAKKAKQHTVYKNAEGKRVVGVTTITGVMDKPALVPWANKLGLEGIKVREYVDDLAQIGTLAHYMAQCDFEGVKPELDDYSKNQISSAENSFLKYLEWRKTREITDAKCELPLISEKYQFGGMCDVYCNLNGVMTLIDIKTCKGIYDDHFTQVSAYALLLEENGFKVDDVRILRIGRDESEGFEDRKVPNIELHQKRFMICKRLYDINKEIKKG